MIVTIDGPAGAGKSTVARELAGRLGFSFLDTGAMYRAVTLICLRSQVDLRDPEAVTRCARNVCLRFDHDRVFANDVEVTAEIRSSQVTSESRFIAGNPQVREHLVMVQRQMAEGADVVSEGRDQGTVAFPHAECKFYLTADARVRAERRQQQLAARGEVVALDVLIAQQTGRDDRDANREVGPLRPADDAVLVDTSGLSISEVLDQMEAEVRRRAPSRSQ